MTSIKKILVPTDFSETADNALYTALLFAETCNAEIYLVHFYMILVEADSFQKPFHWNKEPDMEFQESKNRLINIETFAKHRYPDVKIHALVHEGYMPDELSVLAKTRNIDLIVCGTDGTDWLGEHFMGTNTTTLLNQITIPVLVIPRTSTLHRVKKMVFATDFQPGDLDVLKQMISLAALFGTTVEILHISKSALNTEESKIWMQQMEKVEVKGSKIEFLNLISSGSLEDKLMYYIKNYKVDVLIMTTRGKTIFERIFTGSLSRKMICHANIPVLIYHAED